MLLRNWKNPIKIDRKKHAVKIFDEVFPCKVDDGKYVVSGKQAIEQLGDLTFGDIPRELLFKHEALLRPSYGRDFMLSVRFTSQIVEFNVSYVPSQNLLHTPEEYKKIFENIMKKKGYRIKDVELVEYSSRVLLNTKMEAPTHEAVKLVINGIVSAIRDVNQRVLELEEDAESSLGYILNKFKDIDGVVIVRLAQLRGIPRWIVGALTNSEIIYLILCFEDELVQRYAEKAGVIDFDLTCSKLKALGIHESSKMYSPTLYGEYIADIILDVYEDSAFLEKVKSLKALSRDETMLVKHSWYKAIDTVQRNFFSLAMQKSNRIISRVESFRAYAEKIMKKITFVKLGILMSIALDLPFPKEILEEEISELIKDGIISEKLRLRNYGVWIVRLLSNMSLRLLFGLSKKNYSRRDAKTRLAEIWSFFFERRYFLDCISRIF